MSMDVQMEKVEDLLGLIDSGFSANQVVTAFESTKTLEIEILKNEITKETSGKQKSNKEYKLARFNFILLLI